MEDIVLKHYSTQAEKIQMGLHYLAKRIADIAKMHKPDTWTELKEFLHDQYLDEERILDHWLNQLATIGAVSYTHLTLPTKA